MWVGVGLWRKCFPVIHFSERIVIVSYETFFGIPKSYFVILR